MPPSLGAEGLFEAHPDGLLVLDPVTGTVSAANDRCGELCGRPADSLQGRSLPGLSPDGWTPPTGLETLVDRAHDGPVRFDWRVERPDGSVADLRCAMRLTEADERAVVTVRSGRADGDADATTGDGERGIQELIDAMNDPVFVVDLDGNYVDANRAAVERLGYARTELLSMGPVDISPPEQARRADERLREIAENETLVFESVQVAADGTEIPVEINARRITYRGEPAVLSVVRDVSDRKERTRRLRTFERAVEQAGHAVYITDTDGTIEYVNPAFEEMTGYDAEVAIGRTPRIISSDATSDEYYAELWETILGGDVWQEEIANVRADGESYYAEQTIAPIVEDGEVVNFVAIQQDVTERKEREHELERYQQLIDNVPVGVYRNTPGLAGEFEEVNPAMVEMFDADDESDLLGTAVAKLYRTPGQRERFSRKLDAEGRVLEEMLRLETLDGEAFWGAVTAIRHEVEGEVYYDGIVQDVTERREQARELRLREQRFRRLFEEHNAPMLLVDPDSGHIERANEAAASFYGYEKSELTAMAVQDINQLSDAEVARRRQAADEEERNRFIFPHELADGEVRQVEVDSSPVHTGGQRLLFSIIHDVTEREQNRRTLERQNQQLEVLNRVVRHDIRNDMSVVSSYADLLADHVDDEGAEYLEKLREHGEHVVELTRTVRELMATMLDEGATESTAVSLPEVLTAEVDAVAAGDEDADVRVERPLPDVEVRGNEMLSSVFRNLLQNAIQHTDVDAPTVAVEAEVGTDTVEVRVADDGPGIPDGQKTEIFGKGERGMDSPGTGLGLYLVNTFVEDFGGEVWVTDRTEPLPGEEAAAEDPEGAVFHVELPTVSDGSRC
ncbi:MULTISPECIES: PAS domain S-box protein [Salinibaculum]|uniref:PAS domain S-box protein n=1 Tax=Salinibaculum TaxID=2732368 RepID=UPI0030D4F844